MSNSAVCCVALRVNASLIRVRCALIPALIGLRQSQFIRQIDGRIKEKFSKPSPNSTANSEAVEGLASERLDEWPQFLAAREFPTRSTVAWAERRRLTQPIHQNHWPTGNPQPSTPSREVYELPDDAVIDAEALAKWLGKKRSWVIETANQRRRHKLQLPALKIGREWRFRVGDIRTWLANLARGRAA
jgi:predicted DNA-binding transcriptional regulator AlpA